MNQNREYDKVPMRSLKRGIYETTYGNAAYVSGPKAKTAYDLDMGERVPMSEVTTKWLRKAEPTDVQARQQDWT
jgi:hypothetical protein